MVQAGLNGLGMVQANSAGRIYPTRHQHCPTRHRYKAHTTSTTLFDMHPHACFLPGTLRDESLAINKSLFTLRQVVLALSSNSSQQQQQQVPASLGKPVAHALPGSGWGGGPPGTVAAGAAVSTCTCVRCECVCVRTCVFVRTCVCLLARLYRVKWLRAPLAASS